MFQTNSSIHWVLTMTNVLAVLVGFVLSIVLVVKVLGQGCDETTCQSMLYITTTFMSSRRIETTMGWPVATERSSSDQVQTPFNALAGGDRAYRFGHYLECMYTARMADRLCPPTTTFNDYTACMTNTTVVSALDYCASFPSAVQSGVTVYSHWPTSEEYLNCLWSNPLLQNSESQRASKNVFRSCVEKSLWPFFEIPQTMDTPVLMGSYNWALLAVAGLIVFTSFGVYTAGWKEDGVVNHGEVGYMMRLGALWSGLALLWNIVFFAIFLVVAFRNSGEFQKGGGLPTTSSTTFVTILVFAVAVLYFLSAFLQGIRPRTFLAAYSKAGAGMAKIIAAGPPPTRTDHENQHLMLASTLPSVDPGGKFAETYAIVYADADPGQVARYYTPPMLATWADSYIADVCIVMGMAGATGQLSTDQAWNLFALTLVYRVLNMIISQCISDAFMNNMRLDDEVNREKNGIVTRPGMFYTHGKEYQAQGEGRQWKDWKTRTRGKSEHNVDVHLNTKIIGLSTQLAALYLYVALIYLVFQGNSALNDFATFKTFFVFAFVIPEALRLLLHLFYQSMFTPDENGVPWMLYNAAFFVWLWDFVIRIIFVSVLILEASNNPGTFDFLRTQTNNLMRDYPVALAF